MANLLVLPDRDRPLPGPTDLARLMACRYAVLTVTGRSESGLIHACLDGHGQIAQIPAIWKFHDFLAANAGILERDPARIARAFVEFPAHALLFDTRQSPLAGQLGEAGDLTILVNRGAFQAAMTSALGNHALEPRLVLYAAVLAYEWCIGRDIGDARVVLHHLHHGDWLRSDLLIDRFNLAGLAPSAELRAALRHDLLLVSLRSPMAIARSYPALTLAVGPAGAERAAYYEKLLRLLAQDWLRARIVAGTDVTIAGIRLEDMKADRSGTLARLCGLLGVDAGDPALERETYYGQPWAEDSWPLRRKTLVASRPELDREVCWQDEAFVMGALAGLSDETYPGEPSHAGWNDVLRLLMQQADDPPCTLFPDLTATAGGRDAAAELVWERISFIERFRSLVETRKLGPLPLCRKERAAPPLVSA